MAYQTPMTIKTALAKIQRQELVLPAIQREFVWREGQIRSLFDSLLRGYPIGSFLFWHIDANRVSEYAWYGFLKDYHQRNLRHCPRLDIPATSVTATLDGQQRLTSLNIGLRGSFAEKEPRKRWDNPEAFPKKSLYLNLLAELDQEDNEQGMHYDLRFLTDEAAKARDATQHWFKVARAYDFTDPFDVMTTLQEMELAGQKRPLNLMQKLYRVVHEMPVIAYFEEQEQNLDKVLAIFIRVNSGGSPLSYSDLLLSIATAQWRERDARVSIYSLVDELNAVGAGFQLSKDLVLKAGLMLADLPSVAFRVTNFKSENMKALDDHWDTIGSALRVAVRLLADFGFSAMNLSADSIVIPIAYYLQSRGLDDSYRTAPRHRTDREAMRLWVCRSLVKSGVWGSGLDTLLLALREVLRGDKSVGFPAAALSTAMAQRGKALSFTEEEIQALADSQYGERRTFPLLSLLYSHVDTRNLFHVDHIFPRSHFTAARLRKASVPEDKIQVFLDECNALSNLQLLDGSSNVSKNDSLPAAWLRTAFSSDAARQEYRDRNDLGDVPDTLAGFDGFTAARRAAIVGRLRTLLGASTPSSDHHT